VYPQRCDLSADGRYLCYVALKGNSTWELGGTYIAVSRLPWLTALAAWRTAGTWTRGAHFVADADRCDLGPSDAGDTSGLRGRYGLAMTEAAAYPVERRRGWGETPDTLAREVTDVRDQRRANQVAMARPQPEPARGRAPWDGRARPWLVVRGGYAAYREAVNHPQKPGTGSHPAELARLSSWSQFQSPRRRAPQAQSPARARRGAAQRSRA
jgi:hypothetical protein